MKNLFFTLICFIAVIRVFAQDPKCVWATRAGSTGYDWAMSVAVDNSGSGALYVAGHFTSDSVVIGTSVIHNAQAGTMDVMLIKYDSNGNPLWATAVGSNNEDYFASMVTDMKGSVYIAAAFTGDSITLGDTTFTHTGIEGGFLAKYDSTGILQWVQSISGNEVGAFGNMALDYSDDLFVIGSFYSDSITIGSSIIYKRDTSAALDYFIAKYDQDGNVLWASSIDAYGYIDIDGQENIFIAGGFYDSLLIIGTDTLINNGISTHDIFIAKFDSTGNPLWARKAGNSGDDACTSLAIDGSRNIYITGNYWGPSITFAPYTLHHLSGRGMFLVKYNTIGDVVWAAGSGGNGGDCNGMDLSIDKSGNIIVTGSFGNTPVSFGSNNLISSGLWDIFLVSYNSTGIPLWATSAGGDDYDYANGIALDESGNIYIAGAFRSAVCAFDTFILASSGLSDLFLAKYSLNTLDIKEIHTTFDILHYPNPTNDNLTIENTSLEYKDERILIYNIQGQLIKSFVTSSNKTNVDVSALPCGVYYVKVKTEKGFIVKKFVKE